MRKRGKKYIEAKNKVEKGKLYSIEEAVKLAKDLSKQSLMKQLKLSLRFRYNTIRQQLRGAGLPNGTGKTQVLVLLRVMQQKLQRQPVLIM